MDMVRSMLATPSFLNPCGHGSVYIELSSKKGCPQDAIWIMERLETEFATYMRLGMPVWSKSLQPTREETRPKDWLLPKSAIL